MKEKQQGKVIWILAFIIAMVAASVSVRLLRSPAGKPFALSGKDLGKASQVYLKQCAPCHGEEGFGDGKAAYLLRPRPRDFSQGKFLLVSTDNRIPTDEDLFQTISRGMPGSAMPSWAHLPEQDRRALVRYVQALAHHGKVQRFMGLKGGPSAQKPMTRQAAQELAVYQLEVGKPLQLPPQTPSSENALERGRKIYVDTCAKCHGKEGRGDGQENMEDDLGFKAFPRDFTKGIFKGSPEAKELAYRIMGGMPGSAMPTTEFRSGEDAWAIVHYVQSMVAPGAQERVVQRRQTVTAKKVNEVPNDPEAGWSQVQPASIALMPLWWRDDRIESVEVRAVHDGKTLALQLTWKDSTHNQEQAHVNSFTDGAALQFSSDADPPFFGMGDRSGAVNIWMWKAVWENDLVTRNNPPHPYPRALMDFDMSVKRPGPATVPYAHSKIEDRDPTFYGGWGAGNLTSNPHRTVPVENLNAKGFGSLQAQPFAMQMVNGKGVWKDGVWRYVFLRALSVPGKGLIEFQPGRSVRMGLAVWDGQSGDRNGQKSVTIWHDLALEP